MVGQQQHHQQQRRDERQDRHQDKRQAKCQDKLQDNGAQPRVSRPLPPATKPSINQEIQHHQEALFQTQQKLDAYRVECNRLRDRLHKHEASLNQHIDHYAGCLAKRNFMVKALGREATESKLLIARAEAACLRLETLVENLRTGGKDCQRRAFRVVKSQINQVVNLAVAANTQALAAKYQDNFETFRQIHGATASLDFDLPQAQTWLKIERVMDQLNLNILQLERQVSVCRQTALSISLNAGEQESAPGKQNPSPSHQAVLHGFSHYAWMPTFYRAGTHFQILATSGSEKSIFLNNFLGWIEYNIPRANLCISELTTKPGAWNGREVNYSGVDGMLRHWNDFQRLMETRLQTQLRAGEDLSSTVYREHYAVFDEHEQFLPYAPRGVGSQFRSALVAGNMPKMHLIFVSSSPQCGTVELEEADTQQLSRIVIGEKMVVALIQHHGRALFGLQLNQVQRQLKLWQERSRRSSAARHLSFGLAYLDRNWQFVLLPPAGYFLGHCPVQDLSTKLQSSEGNTLIS